MPPLGSAIGAHLPACMDLGGAAGQRLAQEGGARRQNSLVLNACMPARPPAHPRLQEELTSVKEDMQQIKPELEEERVKVVARLRELVRAPVPVGTACMHGGCLH